MLRYLGIGVLCCGIVGWVDGAVVVVDGRATTRMGNGRKGANNKWFIYTQPGLIGCRRLYYPSLPSYTLVSGKQQGLVLEAFTSSVRENICQSRLDVGEIIVDPFKSILEVATHAHSMINRATFGRRKRVKGKHTTSKDRHDICRCETEDCKIAGMIR